MMVDVDDIRLGRGFVMGALGLLLATGCGSDGNQAVDSDGGSSDGTTTAATTSATTSAGPTTAAATDSMGGTTMDETTGPPMPDMGGGAGGARCGMPVPDGAQTAPPLPTYTGGVCPTLMPGVNQIDSDGNGREFILVVPDNIDPAETLPVVFLWHWLGGDAGDFLAQGDVQNAVNEKRFIAAIPEAKGDLPQRWPYTIVDGAGRFEEEYTFFDDMLACIGEQYNADADCVSSVGVSAGALFTDQLASGRGERLASFVSLSGGVGGLIQPWQGSMHTMPALVLWGGPMDFCIAIDFQATSQQLEADLEGDGHFVLECIHNCAHAEPPFDVPMDMTAFGPMWEFILDHPYWLEDGDSPYLDTGVPATMPVWCDIGSGQAMIREGMCGPDQC